MNRLLAFVALVASALTVGCAELTQAVAPPINFGEPQVLRYETTRLENVTLILNLWERTYAVPGASTTEVGNNLNAFRRTGSGHGPYRASSKWDSKWGLRYADEPQGCRIANATVEIVGVVTLPALASPKALDDGELARWEAFRTNLRAHELHHVDNEVEGARRLQSALVALPYQETCRAVGDAAKALVQIEEQAILEADLRLDAETKHGALTGATFP